MRRIVGLFQRRNELIPDQARLPIALSISVVFALIATLVSVVIYDLDGTYKLDLSRPGFEVQRAEVRSSSTQEIYDTTSPIDRVAIDSFLQEYDKRTQELSRYGDFNDQVLDDANLQTGIH